MLLRLRQERNLNMLQQLFNMLFGRSDQNDGSQGEKAQPVEVPQKKAKGTPFVRVLISSAVTLVFGFFYFYFKLPALNIHSKDLYWMLILMCILFTVCMVVLRGFRSNSAVQYVKYTRKKLAVPFYIVAALLAVMLVGNISGWQVLRARAYSKLLTVEQGDFSEDVAEVSWNEIPLLDADSANNLANRKLGELSDLVSQFTVSTSSAQINYLGAPVRVTYLNYGSFFKWWNNRSDGIPAYMIVDMKTQEVTLVRTEQGIRYSPSEYFFRDVNRYLRFQYPTLIFDDVNFEIDEEGTPYWVASVMQKTIGLFGGDDIMGAVLLNAITGESEYYAVADIPRWVDRVYPADLIINQYDFYGRYLNGFINSLFGQSDCTTTTSGYNYIAQDDDVWLYTGITSVTGDRGNIGFILVNQRTKAARYYSCAGAEEYSAASSAEGAVQQYSYDSTFPLLINISDQPTYFMALKDDAGLVKMYAMVNVQQYQIVATGNSVAECQKNYRALLESNGILNPGTDEPAADTTTVLGIIAEIRSASMSGDTIYFIRLASSEVWYTVNAREFPETVILNVGDTVTVTFETTEDTLVELTDIAVSVGQAAE